VVGLGRMQKHETKCSYNPEKDADMKKAEVMAQPLVNMMSGLVLRVELCEKVVKAVMELNDRFIVHEKKLSRLQEKVQRLMPNYDGVEITKFHMPRYICQNSDQRSFCEEIRQQCDFANPGGMAVVLMQHLMETVPLFWKMKTHDTVIADVQFYKHRIDVEEIPLRHFVLSFLRTSVSFMKDLWRQEKSGKNWFIAEAVCGGYTEATRDKLQRAGKLPQAQQYFQNRIQIAEDHRTLVSNTCSSFRRLFEEHITSTEFSGGLTTLVNNNCVEM
jgi:hypothetical protein